MADHLKLMVKNTLADIPAANEAVSRWMADRNVPPVIDYLANLALEELVTNCIKYGYDDTGEHLIAIELQVAHHEMVLTVTDDGRPFNPLELTPPDTDLPVEDRPIGGLGIHLLRKLSDRMDYERVEGKNRVTLWKRCGG